MNVSNTNSAYIPSTPYTSSSTGDSTTKPETFLGKAGKAVASGDINALLKALAMAKSNEASVYGANGVLRQAGTQSGWDILMGNSSDSSSSGQDSVFKTLTPDIVKAKSSVYVSSTGNIVNTKA